MIIKPQDLEFRKEDRQENQPDATARPVAKPSPTPDGPKPIPQGDLEVEKFNVTADTGGGD